MICRDRLLSRIHKNDIYEMCLLTTGAANDREKAKLYALVFDSDDRVSYNALWVLSNFSLLDNEWLYSKRDKLIDLVLHESHEGKKRMLLSLLERQPFEKDDIRTDFLDYGLEKMLSAADTCSVRSLCLKLSYAMCRCDSDLLREFRLSLEVLESEFLPPSLRAARKNILRNMYSDNSHD